MPMILLRISIATPQALAFSVIFDTRNLVSFVDEVERVFVGRRFEGQHDMAAGRGHVAADDDRFGIERVDEEGDGLADLFARLFDQFDRKVVVVLRRGDDVIDSGCSSACRTSP